MPVVRPGAWPLVGRSGDLDVARAALASDTAGLVIDGAAGVGKSRFAEELLTELAANGDQVVRLLATRAAATIPFGAAAALLGDTVGGEPAAATLLAAEGVAARAVDPDHPLVVGVDDAHLLDDATAGLVYDLAIHRDARHRSRRCARRASAPSWSCRPSAVTPSRSCSPRRSTARSRSTASTSCGGSLPATSCSCGS
jgi:hypothetical protein